MVSVFTIHILMGMLDFTYADFGSNDDSRFFFFSTFRLTSIRSKLRNRFLRSGIARNSMLYHIQLSVFCVYQNVFVCVSVVVCLYAVTSIIHDTNGSSKWIYWGCLPRNNYANKLESFKNPFRSNLSSSSILFQYIFHFVVFIFVDGLWYDCCISFHFFFFHFHRLCAQV